MIFVDAKAKPGGDGSQKKPFRTMGEGFHGRVVPFGTAFYIAPGDYRGYIKPPREKKPRRKRTGVDDE